MHKIHNDDFNYILLLFNLKLSYIKYIFLHNEE